MLIEGPTFIALLLIDKASSFVLILFESLSLALSLSVVLIDQSNCREARQPTRL
jgi:hypothetical protein